MANSGLEIRNLLSVYLTAMRQLRPYGIKTLADYAEYAFEQALAGKRAAGGQKGYDLIAPNLGRVQIKERHLPPNKNEERLHLRNCTQKGCDYLGAVIFNNDYTIKKATLVPFSAVWEFLQGHSDPERKVKFDDIAQLAGAEDLTDRIRRVLE